MFCTKCGRSIPDDSILCPYCGVKVISASMNSYPNPSVPVYVQKKKSSKKAIIAVTLAAVVIAAVLLIVFLVIVPGGSPLAGKWEITSNAMGYSGLEVNLDFGKTLTLDVSIENSRPVIVDGLEYEYRNKKLYITVPDDVMNDLHSEYGNETNYIMFMDALNVESGEFSVPCKVSDGSLVFTVADSKIDFERP